MPQLTLVTVASSRISHCHCNLPITFLFQTILKTTSFFPQIPTWSLRCPALKYPGTPVAHQTKPSLCVLMVRPLPTPSSLCLSHWSPTPSPAHVHFQLQGTLLLAPHAVWAPALGDSPLSHCTSWPVLMTPGSVRLGELGVHLTAYRNWLRFWNTQQIALLTRGL